MKRMLAVISLLWLFAAIQVQAQHYYAVIITTFGPDNFPGLPASPNGPLSPSGNSSLWDDTFLIYQILGAQGYDNLYLFYDAGSDYLSPDPHYYPHTRMTNDSATAAKISCYFQNQLRAQLTDDDVLFVWVFGHGDVSGGITHLLFGNGDSVGPATFSSWFNGVHYKRRIVVMAQCRSGGFIPSLADQKTIVLTACTELQDARWVDNALPDCGDSKEVDTLGSNWFYHSEFNYHLMNALRQKTVDYNHSVPSDENIDGDVSISEAMIFAQEHDSQSDETPQISDIGYNSGSTYLNKAMDLAARGYALSSTATLGNSQRKLLRESSGKLHEVFESSGDVYYRSSTDGGSNWRGIVRLSDGSGRSSVPCITSDGSNLVTVWQQVNGSSYDVKVRRSTSGGTYWDAAIGLGTYSCSSPGPLPTVSGVLGAMLISFRTSSSALCWRKSSDGGITWSATATVPGTSASCNSPSSTVYYTPWSTPQGNLVYATDISTGSPHINYTFYDYNISSWGSVFDLSAVIPSNYVGHANPCLSTSPNASGAWDLHTSWDAQLLYPYVRVIVHRKSTFRSAGSIYSIFQYNPGWIRPSISCVSNSTAWMLCQSPADGSIWKRYYNGTSWNMAAQVTSSGINPQLSVQSTQAKYLYTTGSQSPYQLVLGTESLGKTDAIENYRRALSAIDPKSGAFVTMEIGTPLIQTKDGSVMPINFTWNLVDSIEFDLPMLLKSGLSGEFSLPSNATQIIVPVAIYGKDAGKIFGDNTGTIELNLEDSHGGTPLASVARSTSTAVADETTQVHDVEISCDSRLSDKSLLRFVPRISGLRTEQGLIFSLGHIYRCVGTDSTAMKKREQKERVHQDSTTCWKPIRIPSTPRPRSVIPCPSQAKFPSWSTTSSAGRSQLWLMKTSREDASR